MTSAPVRDVMYGMESVSHANTAKKTETAQEKEHDFRMIMNQAKNQAKQTVHQPNEEKVEKKDISQSKDTYKAEDEYETKETPKKEDFRSEEVGKNKSDKLNNVSEAEPIDEEVETAVEGIVKEVMQEIEEMLEVSEEDNNEVILPEQFKKGIYSVKTTNGKGYIIIVVKGLIEPTVKDLRDARGYYINDYQTYLEKQLVENLRNKYKITVYRDKIDRITF